MKNSDISEIEAEMDTEIQPQTENKPETGEQTTPKPDEQSDKPGFWALVATAMAAAFGVQNRKNLERDFSQSSPLPFIVAGIIFTVIFILTLVFIVKLVV